MNPPIRTDLYILWEKCVTESAFLSIIYFLDCDNFSVHYIHFIGNFGFEIIDAFFALYLFKDSILARSSGVIFIYIFYINNHKITFVHVFWNYYVSESDF